MLRPARRRSRASTTESQYIGAVAVLQGLVCVDKLNSLDVAGRRRYTGARPLVESHSMV